ncbi:MAG: flavodoxin family protein [Halanaerobium sp.]
MKALILNGEEMEGLCLDEISKSIIEGLIDNDFEVEEIILKEKEIADCQGCFNCWVKTPGICIIDDYGRDVAEKVINSELVVFLTPVIFGSYSYQLKKAVDRIISLVSPYFKKINGEVHHKKRYSEYFSLLGIGVVKEEDQTQSKIFKKLVERNSINFHTDNFKAEIFVLNEDFNNSEFENAVKMISKKVGEDND